jgi:hypothetical protein
MSTNYLTDLPIRVTELDALKGKGVKLKDDEFGLILTLDNSHLFVYFESEYSPVLFCRHGDNNPLKILQLIEKAYGVETISEYDDGYEDTVANAERRSQEAKCCPSCSSKDVAEILYGMPCMSKGMERVYSSNQIKLGGCCVEDGIPEWHCNRCEHEWGKATVSWVQSKDKPQSHSHSTLT